MMKQPIVPSRDAQNWHATLQETNQKRAIASL